MLADKTKTKTKTHNACLVHDARAARNLPMVWALSLRKPKVSDPIRSFFGAAENDGDHVIIGSNERLRVVDCVELALCRLPSRLSRKIQQIETTQ